MKKYWILSVYSLLYLGISAQQQLSAQTRSADYTFGGTGTETSAGALATVDGGFLVGGSTSSVVSGSVTLPSPAAVSGSSFDYWLVKNDAQGNKQWERRFGGDNDDRLIKIVAAVGGGYFLCGWSASGASFDKTEPSRGSYDYWVVKVDDSGNKLWDRTFGSQANEMVTTAVASPDGGCVLAGFTSGGLPAGPNGDRTETVLGGSDVWMVKVDGQGAKQWDKRLGGNGDDYVSEIINAPGGGYVVGARAFAPAFGVPPGGDVTGAGYGAYDYWIVKINALGIKMWDRLDGGSGADEVTALLATPDGGILAAGNSGSPVSGNKSTFVAGKDCWLLKLDGLGNKQWDQVYGPTTSTLNQRRPVLALNPSGGYLLGASIGYTDPILTNIPYDYWVAALDGSGVQQWDRYFGGDYEEHLTSIMPVANGNILLVGTSNSNASRDKSTNTLGVQDIWIVRVANTVLGTHSPLGFTVALYLYPNPTSEQSITLKIAGLREQGPLTVEVLNTLGQVVHRALMPVHQGGLKQQFDMPFLGTGLYTVRVHTVEGIITKQFAKN